MIYAAFSAETNQKQALKDQKELHHHQQLKDLKVQDSLFFPPREDKETPIKNNIAAIMIEARAKGAEKLPFTKGCMIANTIKAIAKLINPFPSSLRPLNQSINKIKMIYVVSFEEKLQTNTSKEKRQQPQDLKTKHLKFHYSFLLSPFKEFKKAPTANNIAATTKEAIESPHENSCLTIGCIMAKIIIAVPIFKTVFPSSFRPLNQSIKEIIQQGGKRWRK